LACVAEGWLSESTRARSAQVALASVGARNRCRDSAALAPHAASRAELATAVAARRRAAAAAVHGRGGG
jgi:hypothetical protein